jgi:hypothetical protein
MDDSRIRSNSGFQSYLEDPDPEIDELMQMSESQVIQRSHHVPVTSVRSETIDTRSWDSAGHYQPLSTNNASPFLSLPEPSGKKLFESSSSGMYLGSIALTR